MPIPKIIHYVWFGGKELPQAAQKCIASWKKYLPDYEIKEWNEQNFDVTVNRFCYEAYKAKKYAFVSDFIRIYVLYNYGGIYMDVDVEVVKPFDEKFLGCESFSGYETSKTIPTGIMGSCKGQKFFGKILEYYEKESFINGDGTLNMTTNVKIITDIAKVNGFIPNGEQQTILGFTIYPQTYFCPLSHDTDETFFSSNTYTIHHFSGTWCDRCTRFVGNWNHNYKSRLEKSVGRVLAGIIYKVLYNYNRFLDKIGKE